MNIELLIPLLYTKDVEGTMLFYKTYFGFECNNYNAGIGWTSLSNGNIEIMLSKPNAHLLFDKPIFTGSFYCRLDDVDALWNKLKHQVRVCYPIDNFDYGMREFAVYDNNNYLLQFGSEIKTSD
jgi:uncharacterized glyoxalase superfamily protein PhnB